MRFCLGGFGRKGHFDRLDVSTVADVEAVTITATPTSTLLWAIDPTIPRYTIDFTDGYYEPVSGDVVEGMVNGGSAHVISSTVTSGSWDAMNAAGTLEVYEYDGGFTLVDALSIPNKREVDFTLGSEEIIVGDTITGLTSLNTATVIKVYLSAGTWAGGDAEGYIIVQLPEDSEEETGGFIDEETISSSSGGYAGQIYTYEMAILKATAITHANPCEITATPSIDALAYAIALEATVSLPAVMYYQSLDYTIDLETTVTATPAKYLDWVLNAIEPDPIVLRPIAPTANIFIPPPTWDGNLMISGQASQTMIDKMARATLNYDDTETGDNPNFYFKHFQFQIPDYSGTQQTVFIGFFPSGSATYGIDGESESFTAFDYSWYLTMQYLTSDTQVLLTPADQLTNYRYRLYYTNPAYYWNIGDFIQGGTNGNTGRIVENHLVGAYPVNEFSYIELESVSGTKVGGYYFADDETLLVNGIVYAYADGNETDVTGTPPIITPVEYVNRLLGGDDTGSQYERMTGICPYRMTALPDGWSSTSDPIAVQFAFEEKTTKMQAIEQIAKYIRYIFSIKIVGNYIACAYFIPEADIDSATVGLDLPAAYTVTPTDAYLVSPVTLERKGEEKYNKVTVRCQSLTGIWYESVLPLGGVVDDIPIEYYEINQDIASQAECDARCADLYAYYANQIKTWKATFLLRSDFRLLQKLIFSGDVLGVPNGTYRIVGIDYNYADGGTTNEVTCTIILDSQFKFWLNLNRVFTDSITEVQNIVRSGIDALEKGEEGVIVAVDPVTGAVTIKTDDGQVKTVRNPS